MMMVMVMALKSLTKRKNLLSSKVVMVRTTRVMMKAGSNQREKKIKKNNSPPKYPRILRNLRVFYSKKEKSCRLNTLVK